MEGDSGTGFSRLATDGEGRAAADDDEISSNLTQRNPHASVTPNPIGGVGTATSSTTEVEDQQQHNSSQSGAPNEETTTSNSPNSCNNNNNVNHWKHNYYADHQQQQQPPHPLQVATNALLNVASETEDSRSVSYQQQQRVIHEFLDVKDGKLNWSTDKDNDGDKPLSRVISSSESYVAHPHPLIQVADSSQQSFIGDTSNAQSVLRLSSALLKMEYPHHSESDNNGPTSVVGNGDSVVMHSSQHVEVIKSAGHAPSLHPGDHQHLQHLMNQKEDMQGVGVLQEMKNMPLPVLYEQYGANGVPRSNGTLYGQVTSSVYDSFAPTGAIYGGLANQHSILQPSYANLLAAPVQESYYASVPSEYYSMRAGRPAQPMYTSAETTEELIDRLVNRQQSQQQGGVVSLFTKQPINVEMPSPVDSGLGQDIMVTPKQEGHDSFGNYEMHSALVQSLSQRSNKDYSNERCSSVNEGDSPVHIPKLVNSLGFQYVLEAPNSTSVRKEDDRMTYINKGQFYSVTLDYVHDSSTPLKSQTVKSILMLVFRDEKPYEEEIKCWTFWHSRQHSMKQRILDVDAKNSTGIIGNIEEIAHNAIVFYWNPAEQPAKVNVAVHCLSTDFSTQKGVKGFPLHLQVDTYDESHSKDVPFHRGYCQIKVFCDKGANRKMLHEQRRDEKRRMQGRKKSDGEYHELMERSEFYHMSNLTKPAVLFVPPEEYERPFPSLETFYTMDGIPQMQVKDENGVDSSSSPVAKRAKLSSTSERIVIYVRKTDESVYTPLHLEPPTLEGLINAIIKKYNVVKSRITGVFKQCRKGITVKIDDDMVKHYCNEDSFIMQFNSAEDGATYSITLVEFDIANSSNCSSPT